MEESQVRQPCILLGASNLILGWNAVTTALQEAIRGPVDLYVACGMGRSYVNWSGFGFRRLPGIQTCGLWEELKAAPELSDGVIPRVLITDIGNDLVYGRSPEVTLAAVVECVDRIQAWSPLSDIVVTGLPLESVWTLSSIRFRIARSLLFAGCTLSLKEIQSRAEQTQQLLSEIAGARGLTLASTQREWYGLDPIHVRRSLRLQAFRQYLSGWRIAARSDATHNLSISIVRPTAAERMLFGRTIVCAQPSVELSGIRVSAY
ncbi:MAG: hypothetical protein JNL58_06760 [Planctomyces sp.]|nr:hypothetical protein [Planctomyces sp.]